MMNNYQYIIDIEEVFKQMNLHHRVYNHNAIQQAYDYARDKHYGIKRGTGEAYINHPLRVAKILASWGCESDWVIAGLLHDVVEDVDEVSVDEISKKFGPEVAKYVNSVTKIDKKCPPYDKLSKQERHNLTDAKLMNAKCDAALYIKFADRLDNLYTLEGLPGDKQLEKATHTRDFLMPLSELVGAEKITSEMEEMCFPVFHPDESAAIKEAFESYKVSNIHAFSKTINLIKETFRSTSVDVARDSISVYLGYINNLYINKRSHASIYKQIVKNSDNIHSNFAGSLRKNAIAWYDFTLVLSDRICKDSDGITPNDVFFKVYENQLLSKEIYIIKMCKTSRMGYPYVLIKDSTGNLFRFFIKTEDEYLHYELGGIVDSYENVSSIHSSDEQDAVYPYRKKIKVFKKNGDAHWIDEDATVLDLAFAIHTEVGLHFDYATISGSKSHIPPYQRLTEGDAVEIFTNDEVTAKLEWIKYIKTPDAMQKFYRYITGKMENWERISTDVIELIHNKEQNLS